METVAGIVTDSKYDKLDATFSPEPWPWTREAGPQQT